MGAKRESGRWESRKDEAQPVAQIAPSPLGGRFEADGHHFPCGRKTTVVCRICDILWFVD